MTSTRTTHGVRDSFEMLRNNRRIDLFYKDFLPAFKSLQQCTLARNGETSYLLSLQAGDAHAWAVIPSFFRRSFFIHPSVIRRQCACELPAPL